MVRWTGLRSLISFCLIPGMAASLGCVIMSNLPTSPSLSVPICEMGTILNRANLIFVSNELKHQAHARHSCGPFLPHPSSEDSTTMLCWPRTLCGPRPSRPGPPVSAPPGPEVYTLRASSPLRLMEGFRGRRAALLRVYRHFLSVCSPDMKTQSRVGG